MVEILEPINVWVFFKQNKIQPYLFFWQGRPIKVDEINLIHTSKNGSSLFYHFSVTSHNNLYNLKLDTSKMSWFLEGIESD